MQVGAGKNCWTNYAKFVLQWNDPSSSEPRLLGLFLTKPLYVSLYITLPYWTCSKTYRVIYVRRTYFKPRCINLDNSLQESLERKRRTARKAKLDAIHRYNQRRCSFSPVYGRDLLDAVDCMKPRDRSFRDVGYVHCLNTRSQQESQSLNRVWESTRHLTEIILTPQQYLSKLENILHRYLCISSHIYYYNRSSNNKHLKCIRAIDRLNHLLTTFVWASQKILGTFSVFLQFYQLSPILIFKQSLKFCFDQTDVVSSFRFVFVIPPATAPRSVMHLSHPSPSARNQQMVEEFLLQKEFSPRMTCLHNIIKNQRVQFPELRLIQYDCGE